MNKAKSSKVPNIVRLISGILLVFNCVVLILFFGLMPLLHYSACPVLRDRNGSIYAKGSLAFMREVEPAKLKKGDVALYYRGDTPVGAEVSVNDKDASVIYTVSGSDMTVAVPYRKISGKGTSFSVPMLGSYAHWLINGLGLTVSVAVIGVLFLVFAVSAFAVRYDDE